LPALSLILLVGLSNAQTLPSGTVYYQNISIGSWSGASSQYVQQMINITESNYPSGALVYNGNTANFEFTYANGTVVPAWIEANNSGVITIWVNITNTTSNIYLDFFNTTTNTLSSSGTTGIGEAPQLSSTYAQYDDGASVFNNYWNFAGTTLPNGMTCTSGGTCTVNNGVSISGNSNSCTATGMQSSSTYSAPIALDWYGGGGSSATNGGAYISFGFADTSNWASGICGTPMGALQAGNTASYLNVERGSTTTQTNYASNPVQKAVYTILASTSAVTSYMNYINSYTATASSPITDNIGFFLQVNSGTETLTWLRTRAYPPNGVMPSVSFSSVQQTYTYTPPTVSVSVSNSTIDVNQITVLNATVSGGTAPYTYQWYNATSGSAISGANTSSLIITGVATGTFNYYVSVTDSYPTTVNSTNATITVNPVLIAGNITPSSPAIDTGQSITITLTANPSGGTTPYTYQWFYGNSSSTCTTSISGATSSTYTASPTASTYYCYKVTDSATTPTSNTSASDLVTVNPALAVNVTPASPINTYTYLTVTLNATASGGTPPYTYQWYNATSGTATAISGATSSTLSLQFTASGTYTYFVEVNDSSSAGSESVNSTNATINVALAFTELNYYFLTSNPTTYPNTPAFNVTAVDMANDTITLNASLISYTGDEIYHNTTYVNDTNATITIPIGSLSAGNYTIYFNASDVNGAYIVNSTTFTISKATPNMTLIVPSNLVYNNQQLNITTSVNGIVNPTANNLIFSLYGNNGTGYSNASSYGYATITYPNSNANQTSIFVQGNNNYGLAVGTYSYIFNTTGNQNYTANSINASFSITPATPMLNITIPLNFTYNGIGGLVNYSISTINNQSTAYLSYNFTDNYGNTYSYVNVSSTNNNTTYVTIPTSGIFNFTVYAPATQNYTSASLTNNPLFQITQAVGNISLYLNGTNGNYSIYQHQIIPITANTTENATSDNITIYNNGVAVGSGVNTASFTVNQQPNAIGTYNITAVITNNNYTKANQTYFLTVSIPPYSFTLIPTYNYLLPNGTFNSTPNQIFNLLNYSYNLTGTSLWNITNITIIFPNSTTVLNESSNVINNSGIYNLFTNNSITSYNITISAVDIYNDTLNTTQTINTTAYVFPTISAPEITNPNFINYTYTNLTSTISVFQSGGSFPLQDMLINFGDGTTSTTTAQGLSASEISLNHIYTTAGSYTITANLTDINGFSAVNSTQIQVYNYTPPSVVMNTNTGYIHNQSYIFTATSGSSPLSSATVYWGDGAVSTYTFTPNNDVGRQVFFLYHTYTIPQTYNVMVQIVDAEGLTANYTFVLPVYSFTLPAVTSVLPNEPYNGANNVDEYYYFTVSQGSYPIKNITIYWNDGYGNVPSTVNILNITGGFGIEHVFPFMNNYTITTVICDDLGDCNTQNWGIVLGFPLQNSTALNVSNNFTLTQLYIQELNNKSAFVRSPSAFIYSMVLGFGFITLIVVLFFVIVRKRRVNKS